MKTRHFFSVTVAAISFYLLAPGCTQDFGVFQTCELGAKPCGGECVLVTDPLFGCSSDGCEPCSLAHAEAICESLSCAVGRCTGGFQNCDGAKENGCEVDSTSDPASCGACGTACSAPHAEATCSNGTCGVGTCDADWENCNGNAADGCEANTQNDPAHCGSCETQCLGLQMCAAGECTLVCPDGTGDCNNNPADGCETVFGTTLDCAFCGDTCDLSHAAAQCTAGQCVVENCQNGFGDCDGVAANGCEADLQNSAMTCGTCMNACPNGANGTAVCNGGTCGFNCNSGFGNCDGNLANGCEADTATSVTSCGACGRACSGANVASRSCANGLCNSTCDPGFGNCTEPAAPTADNGCETDTSQNNQSCGGCGNNCGTQGGGANGFECDQATANGQSYCGCSSPGECSAGGMGLCNNGLCSCSAAICALGEACGPGNVCSCNGGAACGAGETCCVEPAGCVNLQTDPQSCGACGHHCPSGFACVNGSCACDGNSDCNAGAPAGQFACTGGLCSCGGTTCAQGERCQPNGTCG